MTAKKTIKELVTEWLETKNFEKGVEILSLERPQMARTFRNREKTYASKLEYELKKLAGITVISATVKVAKGLAELENATSVANFIKVEKPNQPEGKNKGKVKGKGKNGSKGKNAQKSSGKKADKAEGAKKANSGKGKQNEKSELKVQPETVIVIPETPNATGSVQQTTSPTPEASDNKPDDMAPDFIAKIVKEHSHLFKLRTQLGEERAQINPKNHPTYNKKRKILSETINSMSTRIEMLFQAKEDYYNHGTMPDMAILFPEGSEAPAENETEQPNQAENTEVK